MKTYFFLSVLFLITSCVAVDLSPKGQNVRSISPIIAQGCKLIGLSQSEFISTLGAHSLIRNEAAKKGGNAILILSQSWNGNLYEIVAEVYHCE